MTSGAPLGHREQAVVLPASFAQERLWFLDQLDPGRATYNIPMAVDLRGPLEVRVVTEALEALLDRHEVLRTTFRIVDGEPMQVISPSTSVHLELVDLEHLPPSERRPAAFARAGQAARTSFDLARGPLLRPTLIRVSDHEHILLLTAHHIVADLWSTTILFRDFGALYDARRQGTVAALPDLPIQYADFAGWQRTHLCGGTLDRLLGYWTDQLAGAPAEVTFPRDRPRPPTQTFEGDTLLFGVAAEVAGGLARIAREEGATLFMAVLAAFLGVLGRYAGTDDVVVGTPIANRTRPEVENLIGFFSNTLVLRAHLDGEPTFRQMIQRVKAVTLGAYEHQDLPFEQLVAALDTDRNLSLGPLFQVLFGLQTTQRTGAADPGSSNWGELTTGTAKFDAMVLMKETDLGLEGGFEFCTDLYDRQTIQGIVDYYSRYLASVAEDPDSTLSEIARRLAATPAGGDAASAGPVGPPDEASLVELFVAQARRTPEVAAVVTGDTSVTFEELDDRSSRIARRLVGAGAGRGARVGISVVGGSDLPAAVLGVLKAGSAYVPLDPSYPEDRLAYMVGDAGLTLMLTDGHEATTVPDSVRKVVLGSPDDDDADDAPEDAVVRDPHADDPAYVIYTSGSTGRPKGVVMPHRPLVNLVRWQARESLPRPRTLQLAPLSFDVSFQEMFSTWHAGGTLVLCDEALRGDPEALLALARAQAVERIFLPPALLQLMADVCDPTAWPSSLNEIVTAGEALVVTPEIRAVLRHRPGVVLCNQYGPTETHVVTAYRTDAGDPGLVEVPPIGSPIDNARTHVLDGAMVPVPPGAGGELYLGGAVLAQGYLDRPALTAERFVPDPFSATAGARLYRTGDLVRRRSDGVLQFLGRVDDQLKIRGYRVEPGEVQVELEAIPGVRAAAVVGHSGAEASPLRLVAYLEPEPGTTLDPVDLRRRLRVRLPSWMVPEHVLFVDRLPLTPSGKVDRRSLSRRELLLEQVPEESVAARTDLEAALCALWAEVLGLEGIGIHHSFFDLGGHSIAVARVAARVQERLGVEIPLRVFFEATDVETLAREIVLHRALAADPDQLAALLDRAEAPESTVVAGGVVAGGVMAGG